MNKKKAWIGVGCLALIVILVLGGLLLSSGNESRRALPLMDREVALSVVASDAMEVRDEWGKAADHLNERGGIIYPESGTLYILVRSSDGWSARAIQLRASGPKEWEIPFTDPWEEPPRPEPIPREVWSHFMAMFPDGFLYPYGGSLALDAGVVS